jgi:hypothetical protein
MGQLDQRRGCNGSFHLGNTLVLFGLAEVWKDNATTLRRWTIRGKIWTVNWNKFPFVLQWQDTIILPYYDPTRLMEHHLACVAEQRHRRRQGPYPIFHPISLAFLLGSPRLCIFR